MAAPVRMTVAGVVVGLVGSVFWGVTGMVLHGGGGLEATGDKAEAGALNNRSERGHDVVVAWQLPKLLVRVRFPLPAPESKRSNALC